MEAVKRLSIILFLIVLVLSFSISCSKDKSSLSDEEIKALKEIIEQQDKENQQLTEELEKAGETNQQNTSSQSSDMPSDETALNETGQSSGLVAFSSRKTEGDKRQIYIVKEDGTGRINISNNDRDESDPIWSPDGSKLLIRSEKDGKVETFLLNKDGSQRVNLSDNKKVDKSDDDDKTTEEVKSGSNVADEFGHEWSPDGSKVIFVLREARDDGKLQKNWHLVVMDADGSNRIKLAEGLRYCSWFPDGSKILFSAYKDIEEMTDDNWYTEHKSQLYTINADGSGKTNISNNSYDEKYFFWSPDGSKILFDSNIGTSTYQYQVHVMNADGSERKNLSNNNYHEWGSKWSPDGSMILFESNKNDKDSKRQIYIMNADGSGKTNLSNNDFDEYSSKWSPDGSKILFVSDLGKGIDKFQIHTMNADGTDRTNISNNEYDEFSPYWTPDGNMIVFSSDLGQDEKSQLHIMSADGTGRKNLSNNNKFEVVSGFSLDGSKIIVMSAEDAYLSGLTTYMISIDNDSKIELASNEFVDENISFSPATRGQNSNVLQKK